MFLESASSAARAGYLPHVRILLNYPGRLRQLHRHDDRRDHRAEQIGCRKPHHMIRYLKRRSAIGSYFWRLSQAVSRRFGRKNYYSIDEVSTAAEAGRFDLAFITFAHAMFCSRDDFNAYYGPLQVACTYEGLRVSIARRFFGGAMGFDATNILLRADAPMDREYAFTEECPGE